MKQINFIVEVTIKDSKPLIITRDPRTGRILDVASSVEEHAAFLTKSIDTLSASHDNE